MPRGGRREGAGRKPGTPNKSTSELREALSASGELPVEYMLRVMRDKSEENDRRDRMAVAAAPYLHAKLAATEITGKDGGPIETTETPPRDLARAVLAVLREARIEESTT